MLLVVDLVLRIHKMLILVELMNLENLIKSNKAYFLAYFLVCSKVNATDLVPYLLRSGVLLESMCMGSKPINFISKWGYIYSYLGIKNNMCQFYYQHRFL